MVETGHADDPDIQSNHLADFINDHINGIIRSTKKPAPGKRTPETIHGLDFNVREYMARIATEDKWMMVSERKLKEWCKKKIYSYPDMKKTLVLSGRCTRPQNQRKLTAQTNLKPSADEYLLEFDLTLPANERFLPQ
jgi:uncharacterized membrane protein